MTELNPLDVERDLQRLSARLEDLTLDLAEKSQIAAQAEADYKRKFHTAMLSADGTVPVREAKAFIAAADEYEHRLLSAATRDALQEGCRSVRAQLSAVQSIGATLRELVTR